jgi:hypothetical protein
MSDKDRDSGFDAALRGTLGSLSAAGSAACPDENRLAAYLERRLAPAQREAIEVHASRCASCQETLALALELGDEPRLAEPSTARPEPRVLFRFSFPLATLGLLMVAVGIGVVLLRGIWEPARQARVAEVQRPSAPITPPVPSAEPAAREVDLDRNQAARAIDRVRPAGAATQPGRKDDLALGARGREEAPAAASPVSATAPAAVAEVSKVENERASADAALRDERRKNKDGEHAELRPAAVPPPPAAASGGVAGGKVAEAKAVMSAVPTPREAIEGFAQLWAAQPIGNANVMRNAAKSAQISNRGPLVAQNQNAAPQNAGQTTRSGTQNVLQKGEPLPPPRLVGDRTFYLYMGYWVDERSASTTDAEIVNADAAVREEIRAALPGILDLRASGGGSPAVTILVWWKDKIYVLR